MQLEIDLETINGFGLNVSEEDLAELNPKTDVRVDYEALSFGLVLGYKF